MVTVLVWLSLISTQLSVNSPAECTHHCIIIQFKSSQMSHSVIPHILLSALHPMS
jgi:hypothetical protein